MILIETIVLVCITNTLRISSFKTKTKQPNGPVSCKNIVGNVSVNVALKRRHPFAGILLHINFYVLC